MHPYRTHRCGELRLSHTGEAVRLSGWIHRKRDHGQLLFIDLRDTFGVTQCVVDVSSPLFLMLEGARVESVLTLTGRVYPIGGVREKLLAAKRQKIRHVILPAANEHDYDEVPEQVAKGIQVHFVDTFEDVLALVF